MSRFIGLWALSREGRIGKILQTDSTYFGRRLTGIGLDGKPWEYKGSEPILVAETEAVTLETVLSQRGAPQPESAR